MKRLESIIEYRRLCNYRANKQESCQRDLRANTPVQGQVRDRLGMYRLRLRAVCTGL